MRMALQRLVHIVGLREIKAVTNVSRISAEVRIESQRIAGYCSGNISNISAQCVLRAESFYYRKLIYSCRLKRKAVIGAVPVAGSKEELTEWLEDLTASYDIELTHDDRRLSWI